MCYLLIVCVAVLSFWFSMCCLLLDRLLLCWVDMLFVFWWIMLR